MPAGRVARGLADLVEAVDQGQLAPARVARNSSRSVSSPSQRSSITDRGANSTIEPANGSPSPSRNTNSQRCAGAPLPHDVEREPRRQALRATSPPARPSRPGAPAARTNRSSKRPSLSNSSPSFIAIRLYARRVTWQEPGAGSARSPSGRPPTRTCARTPCASGSASAAHAAAQLAELARSPPATLATICAFQHDRQDRRPERASDRTDDVYASSVARGTAARFERLVGRGHRRHHRHAEPDAAHPQRDARAARTRVDAVSCV